MRPPDGVGRCRACPLRAPLYDGLCIACSRLCARCGGSGRVTIDYRSRPGRRPRLYRMAATGPIPFSCTIARRCQSCDGSGRSRRVA